MSAPFHHLSSGSVARTASSLVLLCLACSPTSPVHANEAGASASASDPTLVVTRTVNPRIAYRGVPTEDNPVRAQATTFPAGVFRGAIDSMIGQLAGDGELGERGTAGAITDAMLPIMERGIGPMGAGPSGSGRGVAPIGPGASASGAVGGATRGLASTITGSLPTVTAPVQQGAGP